MARIMIVDDSMLTRRMLRNMLAESGHEVVCEAADGASAVDLYREFHPDVVTMDINMPGLDGLHASEMIHAEFPRARIVMATSINASGEVNHALRAGASSYVLKPFRKEKVLESIEWALRG